MSLVFTQLYTYVPTGGIHGQDEISRGTGVIEGAPSLLGMG